MSDFLSIMKTRINYTGETTNDRIHNSEYRNFCNALSRSPQSLLFDRIEKTIDEEEVEHEEVIQYRALVTQAKVNQDRNQKNIAVDFKEGIGIGSICHWVDNDSYWLITNRRHEELPYFKGEMDKCTVEIELPSGRIIKGVKRSPVETTTPNSQKKDVIWEKMNSSVKLTFSFAGEEMLEFFNRGKIVPIKIFLEDVETGDIVEKIENYKVVARDIQNNGRIIEVYGNEYYSDTVDKKEEELPPVQESENPYIKGEQTVYVYDTELEYSIYNATGGKWEIDNPKLAKITYQDDKRCQIDILSVKKGEFYLKYDLGSKSCVMKIKIESI